MRLRGFFCFLVSLLLCCAIGFSSVSINARADNRTVTYTKITRSAGLDIFGSMLPYTVTYNGVSNSGYFILKNDLVDNCSSINIESNSVFNSSAQVLQYDWLVYEATGVIPEQGFADFDIDIPVYFSDSARGAFLMSYTGLTGNVIVGGNTTYRYLTDDNSRTTYPFNYLFNTLSSTEYKAPSLNTNASSSLSDYYGYLRLDYSYEGVSDYYYYRPCIYDISGGCQFLTVHFEHVRSTNDGTFGFAIACPYVYGDIQSGSSVTTTTAVSGTDINVNVDVDLTETNTILGTISSLLSGLIDGIKGLFVPDQEWLVTWINSVKSTLTEFFTFYPAANAMVDQAFDTILEGSAVESIYFPAIELPDITGQTNGIVLYSGGYVPLLPQSVNFTVTEGVLGTATFFDYMKYLIDIVATMYVINMVRNKFKAVLVGESVVDVDGGDEQ